MALQHTRILSKFLKPQYIQTFLTLKRFNTTDGDGNTSGAPYRPGPMDQYYFPKSAQYWSENGYKPQSEQNDEIESEEVYLDEIEDRMRKYDKKYSQSDRVKKLYNEFAFEHSDDRAFTTYGAGLSSTTDDVNTHGRGNKIDPSNYINGEYSKIGRKNGIAPIEYMTPEQVRRSRGSLAMFRELPPEKESIFKFWNAYSVSGVFFTLLFAKEWCVFGHHDMFDAVLLWGFFGLLGSVAGEFFAWCHTISFQENYDKKFFQLTKIVNDINAKLESLKTKPNERKLFQQLLLYRNNISEKVLQKTLSNRLQRIVDNGIRQIENKIQEEASIKAAAEASFRKEALEGTESYFESDSVRRDFTAEALRQFLSGDTAKLDKSKVLVQMESDVFINEYNKNLENARSKYIDEQSQKGTLNWVFKSKNDIESSKMSKSEKENIFTQKLQEWQSTRNTVDSPMPQFT